MQMPIGSLFRRWFASSSISSQMPARHCGPAGVRAYVIGDIHGERRLLDKMLRAITDDFATVTDRQGVAVFLGDYVDRGPDSRAVLDCLIADPLPGFQHHYLLGNHEAAMLDFLADPPSGHPWLDFGGLATLTSYGVRASAGSQNAARMRQLAQDLAANLPDPHLKFLQTLSPSLTLGDYLCVHAGIRPGTALDRQSVEDLIWIREPFLSSRRYHGKMIVHGHTVVDTPEFWPNRIAIDTGAYAGGGLSALVIDGPDTKVLPIK